jgi:hypothetical protein
MLLHGLQQLIVLPKRSMSSLKSIDSAVLNDLELGASRLRSSVILSTRMRRILFVNPPIGRYDWAEIAPPLSLLTLASSATSAGYECSILDLNLPEHREHADHSNFYEYAVGLIARDRPSDVMLTSMGVNTHVAAALGAAVAKHTGANVIIGGIHAESIECVLKHVVPPGVTVHSRTRGLPFQIHPLSPLATGDAIARSVDVDIYFQANPRRLANIETGRGCKYKCAFCYSPTTHSSWTASDPHEVSDAFSRLAVLGVAHAFVVDDNLLNSQQWFLSLCHALSKHRSLTWNGYATLPDLKPDFIAAADAAGCTSLYVGIDVVAPSQQRALRKPFYRSFTHLKELLNAAKGTGLTLTCAFIIDLRPSADECSAASLTSALNAAQLGADIRLSVLTPYPGTPIANPPSLLEYCADRADILFDLPRIAIRNDMARSLPACFPWHTRPASVDTVTWRRRLRAVHAAQVLLERPEALASNTDSGAELWRHCLEVAVEEELYTGIHKTELKTLVRNIHAAAAA